MTRVRWTTLLSAVLAGLILLFVRLDGTGPTPVSEQRLVAWSVDFESIDRIAIDLRSLGSSQAWVRGRDGEWHFGDPGGGKVDDRRWGVGIPLLVSGPEAQRLIAEHASEAQLEVYGLADPQMTVNLRVAGGAPIDVEVGARTPDGSADYVRVVGSPTVYAVHHSWKDTLARLVLEPPIAPE